MTNPFVPKVGAILSADIAVPEHEGEVNFYSRILCTGENALWREKDLMNNLGQPIIGLGALNAEYAHLPLQWMPHIMVADVAASAQHAIDLGGSVLMQDKQDDGCSQWAVLLDPIGAAFGIIPVGPPEGPPPSDVAVPPDQEEPVGCIAWVDLTVSDASTIREFYRQVVGWSVRNVEMEDGGETYTDFAMLGESGNAVAGVCHARGVNHDLPPTWMIYLPVGDLAESLRRVNGEGGAVIKAVEGENGEYVYAVIRDPVGAYLALMPG